MDQAVSGLQAALDYPAAAHRVKRVELIARCAVAAGMVALMTLVYVLAL